MKLYGKVKKTPSELEKAGLKIPEHEEMTLEQLSEILEEKSLLIITMICLLPFMQPIPIPGVSSLLGLVIIFQGFALMSTGKIWLNQRMRNYTVKTSHIDKFKKFTLKFSKFSNFFSVLKSKKFFANTWIHRVCGLMIVLSGIFLSLPLPIPMSNFIPALCMMFLTLALLEDDLLMLFLGSFVFIFLIFIIVWVTQIEWN